MGKDVMTETPSMVPNTLTYDADGNLTNNNFAYAWDCENRLIGASNTNMVAGYTYDYMSRRSRKVVNGTTTNIFVYDGWNLISEICNTESESITNRYVWGLDLSGTIQGAGGIGGLLAVTRSTSSNTATYYPCYDANGNISDYVDTSGTVVAHREYDAFGNTVVATGSMVNDFNFWFSTKYLDQETGLYYYGYRYYDPVTGRWLSQDPLGDKASSLFLGLIQKNGSIGNNGINLYLFVLNNSLIYVDIYGLNPSWWYCERKNQTQGYEILQHAYLDYGENPFSNEMGIDDSPANWGKGFGPGGTYPETHFNPNKCRSCAVRSSGYIEGTTKPCKCASNSDIMSCINKHKPTCSYTLPLVDSLNPLKWYTCSTWAKEAAKACCLNIQ